MERLLPWEFSNIPGPWFSSTIDMKAAFTILKRAKRPLMILGGGGNEKLPNGKLIADYAVDLAKVLNATLVVSPGIAKYVSDWDKVVILPIQDAVNRMTDANWSGFDGKGPYDFVAFIGGIYRFQSQMLSTIRNFAPHARTISLDRFYHPNATFSLPNTKEDEWLSSLDEVIEHGKSVE